ncbi:MAG: hypothetical protein A3B66_02340 [Alphaproteobacteria bacterium RIFCSPHIGHO2_02_FULL_46_13]|nr:MAG: hypothetical protein A3B66_02340 [Alphaproteobacteria bacterium RIFCSPHIGHO2_02_FULL_46_13]
MKLPLMEGDAEKAPPPGQCCHIDKKQEQCTALRYNGVKTNSDVITASMKKSSFSWIYSIY